MKWTKGNNVPYSVQLKWDDGTNIDLIDTTVLFEMISVETGLTVISSSADIIIAIDSTVQYQWSAGETDTDGLYETRWTITFNSGKKYTIPNGHNEYIHIR